MASARWSSAPSANRKPNAKWSSGCYPIRSNFCSSLASPTPIRSTPTVTPLPAALLALQPAGYPGNHTTLEQTRTSLRAGRAALAEAATLARQVIADLK